MTASDSDLNGREPDISYLLLRPLDAFNRLPISQRWEFTRRHPYYLAFWRQARNCRENPSSNLMERQLQEASSSILTTINVSQTVTPPDPASGAEEIEATMLGDAWQGGAVAPAILRSLAMVLLTALPKQERAQLGRLLTESAEYERTDVEQMYSIQKRLVELPGEMWNSFPNVPFISINLQASQRAIAAAVEELVRKWKAERSIPEIRQRDDKLDEYLAVWDLREGWVQGTYDSSREQRLVEIAKKLKTPLSTVANRYRSAFECLTGHRYSPELWIRLFGPIKFSKLSGSDSLPRLAQRRPWRSKNIRPVVETVLLPGRTDPDNRCFLETAGVTASDIGQVELQLDVQSLIELKFNDEQIVRELDPDREFPSDYLVGLIAFLRARHADSL